MAVAGRVLIIPKGDWNADTTYKPLDLVSYNASAWLCKQTCVGLAPSATNEAYWFKMSSIALANNLNTSETGFALDARQGRALNQAFSELQAGNTVLETEVTNLTATVNGLMGTNIASEYDSTATYEVGEYVTYNNDLYKCIEAITVPESFTVERWKHCYIMEEIDDKVTAIVEEIVNGALATEIGNLTAGAGLYGECTTDSETANKVATITGFTLKAGARVTIDFKSENKADNPTLNVSETGAKTIMYRSADGNYAAYKDIPNGTVTLTYVDSYWVVDGIAATLTKNLTEQVQTKYDDVTGNPMWKDGADTWHFFSGGVDKLFDSSNIIATANKSTAVCQVGFNIKFSKPSTKFFVLCATLLTATDTHNTTFSVGGTQLTGFERIYTGAYQGKAYIGYYDGAETNSVHFDAANSKTNVDVVVIALD